MKVEVLGSGCANCRNTVALIEQVAQQSGLSIDLQKVEDIQAIMGYGVMTTPAVVVDGKVVHAGGIPRREAIAQWLTPPQWRRLRSVVVAVAANGARAAAASRRPAGATNPRRS